MPKRSRRVISPSVNDNVEVPQPPFGWDEAGSPPKTRNVMRFDLTDLRLFLLVVETSSITLGAKQANMALASASERIRGMEDTLGTNLLDRGSRGIKPTPAGRALVHHARTVLQQLENMRGELREYAGGLKGHVRVLSNTAGLVEFLPEVLTTFLAANQGIDIDLEERSSHEIVPAIAAGLADIGIVADLVDIAGVESFPFATDRLVLIVPKGHPLGRRRQLAFVEALDHEFIGLKTSNPLQLYIGQHAARAGRQLKLRVRLSSIDTVCRMVDSGVGVAVIPESAMHHQKRPAIQVVRLTDSWALRKLVICVRRFSELSPHAKNLIEHLRTRGR
jgi:DNA-binding transcriptional LysR family regulator